jgi:hypothetical protein
MFFKKKIKEKDEQRGVRGGDRLGPFQKTCMFG